MRTKADQSGLTLIETILAVCIFGIAVAGMCALVTQTRRLSDRARDHYIAINLAKNQLEEARTVGYDQLVYLLETNTEVNCDGSPEDGANFRRSTSMVTNAAGYSNLAEIVVTVEIRDRETTTFDGEREGIRSYFADYLDRSEY